MADEQVRRGRVRAIAIEIAVAAALLTGLGVFGLYKMDYLGSSTPYHVRMTDNSRSAYVAKQLVEGHGYTTKELPAFMLGWYEQQGKLHTEAWPNADRFPFTTWAIAALFTVSGSTSWEVGILGYNLICFVGFFLLLYAFARALWRDRWAALATMAVALLHPLAYVYPLYMKDADMLFLTTAVVAGFVRYFQQPTRERLSWRLTILWGLSLALLFLARPNVGGGFIACLGAIALHRVWSGRRAHGLVGSLVRGLRREGLVAAVVIVACVPFAIQSFAEWGSPFFSANALYQRPLGTRFAMDTDTWFKYAEPGPLITLDTLIQQAPGQLIAKFTTSWVSTLKVVLRSFAVELILGLGLIAWLRRRRPAAAHATPTEPAIEPPVSDELDVDQRVRDRAFVAAAQVMGVVVVLNFALLPLYGYQNYAYRHYLSFFMPVLWLAGGRAVVEIARAIRPAASRAWAHLRAHRAAWLLGLVIAIVAWNFGPRAQDTNQLFVRLSDLVGKHWLLAISVLLVVVSYRLLMRMPRFGLGLLVVGALVFGRFQPFYEIKRNNLNWFPADLGVWKTLREGTGLVMSFALQGEVNWASDRRNIPAPENILHTYSFLLDHELEVEDVYIESAETMIGPYDGPFFGAAPGFESFARMERYQAQLPGYEIVFHRNALKKYPKYRVTKARPKASTVYRLTDRAAVRRFLASPDRIELGTLDAVVHTTYGWGGYYTIAGKRAVAATDAARSRYPTADTGMRPWEATSASFFLDARRPTSVELEVYATHRTTLTFYWNLDLYYYDAPRDRAAHAVGTYQVAEPGWQTVRLTVPYGVTRQGLNKLGFDASEVRPVTVCPPAMELATCATIKPSPTDGDVVAVTAADAIEAEPMRASVFVGTLRFHY